MISKHGSAVWQGSLQEGTGTVSTETGLVKDETYTFANRFQGKPGTNPEELLGAAHASCFAMAFSMLLGERGLVPDRIEATSTVTLDEAEGGFAITTVHLDVEAEVPNADEATFKEAAEAAKAGCPVSKLFATEITIAATLV